MRWLQPREIGLYSSITILQAYTPFFQLGIQNGLNVDLPILLGQNNKSRAMELVANAKAIAVSIMLFFFIAGTISTLYLYYMGIDIAHVLGILTISVIAISETMRIHLIATFRSANAFDKLTKLFSFDIVLSLVLIYFIYKYHYYGLLIFNGLSSVASSILMYNSAPYKKVKLQFNKEPIVSLTKKGLIIMIFNQLRLASKTIPKWIILSLGSVTKLGLFSPANAIGGLMTMLPHQIAQFFVPQMGYKYGQTGNAKVLWPHVMKVLIYFPLISVPVSICVWLMSPWLLLNFFPNYIGALRPMRIMAVGFIFSSSVTTQGILYTIRAYNYAFIYSLTEILGYFLFPILFLKILSYDILSAVAFGISCNSFFLYVMNVVIMKKVLFLDRFNRNIEP